MSTLPVLPVREVGALHLSSTIGPGGNAWIAAASGLVRTPAGFCVVADDELHLGMFDAVGVPGRLLPLFAGALPHEARARKAGKPDLEALCRLPPTADAPHGALLALGSGSKATRHRGARVRLDAAGRCVAGPSEAGLLTVELGPLHRALGSELPELNLEGAAVRGNELLLLQRGNGASGVDAIVRLSLPAVLEALGAAEGAAVIGSDAIVAIERIVLPELEGVRLGFTDASPLPDGRLVFAAAAEDSPDTYEDGAVRGSAVGLLGPRGIEAVWRLAGAGKVEGVDARLRPDGALELLLVTDDDDPSRPAGVFEAVLAR